MATTTKVSPDKDTYLWSASINSNYGTATTMRIGTRYSHGIDSCYNIVMEFDVSAITDPSAIVEAGLTLKMKSTTGTLVRTITVSRLGIDFTEADPNGADWVSPVGNTLGTNPWVGGTTYKEADVPKQYFSVGSGASDVTIDLVDFVRDAITRRSGVLRLLLSDSCGVTLGASGYTTFHTTRAASLDDKPELDIIVADRIVWNNATGTGVLSTDGNWVGGSQPDYADFAMFTNGSEDATGILTCHSLFIGSEYTGQIGTVDDDVLVTAGVDYENFRRVINKKRGQFFINDVVSASITTKIFVSDTPTGSVYERTNAATAIVSGGDLEFVDLAGTLTASRAKNAGTRIKLSGTASDIIASHCKLTLENGCASGIYVDGTKVTCTDGTIAGAQTISGNSTLVYRGKTISGACTIYKGRLTFQKNENAEITTSNIYLYKGAVFDSRTDTGAWSPSAIINVTGGGNFMVDVGKTVALGT